MFDELEITVGRIGPHVEGIKQGVQDLQDLQVETEAANDGQLAGVGFALMLASLALAYWKGGSKFALIVAFGLFGGYLLGRFQQR